jgi:hypothetical protein
LFDDDVLVGAFKEGQELMVVVQEVQVLKHLDEADVLGRFQEAIELRENCVSLILHAGSL